MSEQLVEFEQQHLCRFFGREIAVPPPPKELFSTVEMLKAKSIQGFEAHYLPACEFKPENKILGWVKHKEKIPGWKLKPEGLFWKMIKDGRLSKDAANLQGGWYLIDGRPKPDLRVDRQQVYQDDYLAGIMQKLRSSGKLERCQVVPDLTKSRESSTVYFPQISDHSRFGASAEEVEQVILPELAEHLLTDRLVRTPRALEFNVLGNLYHPEWGQTDAREWFYDTSQQGSIRLAGGNCYVEPPYYSGLFHGLTRIEVYYRDLQADFMGFRPMIVFQ